MEENTLKIEIELSEDKLLNWVALMNSNPDTKDTIKHIDDIKKFIETYIKTRVNPISHIQFASSARQKAKKVLESLMLYSLGRPIEGVSLNGLEWVLNKNNEVRIKPLGFWLKKMECDSAGELEDLGFILRKEE